MLEVEGIPFLRRWTDWPGRFSTWIRNSRTVIRAYNNIPLWTIYTYNYCGFITKKIQIQNKLSVVSAWLVAYIVLNDVAYT
jgi:hypothetical protein